LHFKGCGLWLLSEGGLAAGVRDAGLLESALARPRQLQAYGEKPGIVEMAAAYVAGIVRNHPFFDGNKRTGFVVGVLFLEMNGYRFTASEEGATQGSVRPGSGNIRGSRVRGVDAREQQARVICAAPPVLAALS